MKLVEYSIKNRVTSWIFALILLIGGIISYQGLGRLEDPEFTIKQAMINTAYPGASPSQVESEVTYAIENAIQQLPYVDFVTSISSAGLSQVIVEMKPTYRKKELKQIWDELRHKITDLQPSLPSGVLTPTIIDDFGDVYGILLAISGDEYQEKDLKDYVDYLRRELVLVDGVGKVTVAGAQQEQVIIEFSQYKLAKLGISAQRIFQLLNSQLTITNAGAINISGESIRFQSSGELTSLDDINNLLISKPGDKTITYLGDVARVYRDYAEVSHHITHYNNHPALLLGISFASGVNVIEVGENIDQRLAQLAKTSPLGINIATVYNQPKEVDKSMQSFITSLVEAVIIVIIVLLIFMGLRSGLLIGLILVLTVLGTFIFMKTFNIALQRVSLGALIIALGMLVDNAIVITEGILIGLKKGQTKLKAAVTISQQTYLPLLGATIIAIVAFAPIGLSPDATGEFAGSLFWVLLISLLLSWVTAITLTPFFADLMFKKPTTGNKNKQQDEMAHLYKGAIFTYYKALLGYCLQHKKVTIVVMLILFTLAAASFSKVKQSFFPPSNTPMFYLDYWRYQGSDIRATQQDIESIQAYLLTLEEVEQVTTTVGRGAPRFMLTYIPEKVFPAYGQLIIRVKNREILPDTIAKLRDHMSDHYPQAEFKIKRMEIGPPTHAKIEARFSGPDPDMLRKLATKAKAILQQDPHAMSIRDDWRQRTKLIKPEFNQANARKVGVTKQAVDQSLQTNFSGSMVGVYKEGTQVLPIVARTPAQERLSVDSLPNLQIYSPVYQQYIPIKQVVDTFTTQWEDSLIMRRDRKRTITVMAEPDILGDETAAGLLARVKPSIEAITLPEGYSLTWGGEYEAAGKAQHALFKDLPLGYLIMLIITILLFNSIKDALIIWFTVPLALIGVTLGLLVMNAPFSFMALLGLLSLSGMLVKNGIVLVEQINLERQSKKQLEQAIIDSAISRVRPVTMAAITTILGMIPLLFDVFFESMAVTIMFGLGFATLLTLIVVPVLYSLVYDKKQ
jgi:multidrug efflux pump subunit AcrB